MYESPIPSLPAALRDTIQTAIDQPGEVPEMPPTWLTSAKVALQNEDFTAMRRCMESILKAHSQYRAEFDIKGWLFDLRRISRRYQAEHNSENQPGSARRYNVGTTGDNLHALSSLLADPQCTGVSLFATLSDDGGRFSDQTDGPVTNLPLVAALAQYSLPAGLGTLHIVFDGPFLTAARPPRFNEVSSLLDTALHTHKATVHLLPFDFTSCLTPENAAALMLDAETVVLDESSLGRFVALLFPHMPIKSEFRSGSAADSATDTLDHIGQ